MADGNAPAERWYGASELAGLPGLPTTERRVRATAHRNGWASRHRKRGKGNEYAFASLPAKTQTHLLLATREVVADNTLARCSQQTTAWTDTRRAAAWSRFDRATQAHKDIAHRRLKALLAVDTLVAGGRRVLDARAIVAAQLKRDGVRGGSVPSLGRWAADIAGVPADCRAPALLPSYAGRNRNASMPTGAWDQFKADYLRPSAPSATSCYERVQRVAAREGWALPCLRTFEREIERQLSRQVVILAREGEEALMRTFPAQERDHTVYSALEAVNADGHRFDVFCRWPDGTIARPLGLFWQDIYSGKMLARRIGQTENSTLVRLSFADMARTYGLPRSVLLDNGRSFANKFLTGGTPTRYRFKVRDDDPLGVLTALVDQVHWATPYHGQAKPIERAFRDFADRIAKHPAFEGAYTGNAPGDKPENYGSRAIDIDTFVRVMDEEILAHNARPGREAKACKGRSFDVTFNQSYQANAVRKASAEQLRSLLLCTDKVTAHRHDASVTLAGLGNRYWTEALSPYAGQPVLVRFDPEQLHSEVAIYTLAGEFIGDAPCVAAVGFADVDAGREHARARKQYRNAAKTQREAEVRMSAAQVAAQLPSPPPENLPEASVVQGAFGKRHTPAVARPQPEAAQQRTGTDDAPQNALGDLLARMQAKQNADRGWEPHDNDD